MATSFSFSGNFLKDDDLAIFTFTVLSSGTVTLRTFGYGGGTNAAGQIFLQGGFDPTITVFTGVSANSTVLGTNDDAPNCIVVNQDTNTNACWDSYLVLSNLAPGSYKAVISQYNNNAGIFLSDPFSQQGNPNYTGIANLNNNSLSFIDLNPAQRTSFWAIDFLGNTVSNVTFDSIVIPEPSTFLIFGGGLLALWTRRSKINKSSPHD